MVKLCILNPLGSKLLQYPFPLQSNHWNLKIPIWIDRSLNPLFKIQKTTLAQRGQQCFKCFFQWKISGGNALLSKSPLKIFDINYFCYLNHYISGSAWQRPEYSAPILGTFLKSQRKVNSSSTSNQFWVHFNIKWKLSQYDTYLLSIGNFVWQY